MKTDVYSSKDFTELKKRINKEILRRGSFKWWRPLTTPAVGTDKSSPMSLPKIGKTVPVNERTYTINTPSDGSIEPTRNVRYPNHGDNPGGEDWKNFDASPDTSAANFTVYDIKNFLVGLANIHDIDLFYGRDEVPGLAYRDPSGILKVLENAEADKLHELAGEVVKVDPNRGVMDHRHPTWPNVPSIVSAKIEDYKLILIFDNIYPTPDIKINEDGELILAYEDYPNELEGQLASIRFFMREGYQDLYMASDGVNFENQPDLLPQADINIRLDGYNLVEDIELGPYQKPEMYINADGDLILYRNIYADPIEKAIETQEFKIVDGDLVVSYEKPDEAKPFKDYLLKFPMVDGHAVMYSGEYDGEQLEPRRAIDDKYHANDPNRVIHIDPKILNNYLIIGIDEEYNIPDIELNADGELILHADEDPDRAEKQLAATSFHIDYNTMNLVWDRDALKNPNSTVNDFEGLGPHHFYDDYGAQPGDSDYHPYNPYHSPVVYRNQQITDDQRKPVIEGGLVGGTASTKYGPNPRNPVRGDQYPPRPIFQGVPGTCQVACSGLCSISCDDACSESCTTTCTNRCGNACASSCKSGCSNTCSTQCRTTCKTGCENISGYSCVNAGAKALKITTSGGQNGEPIKIEMDVKTYSCNQTCSYSCQYYPNKKTTCWDAGCMGNCFTSCDTGCANSCLGGCIGNDKEQGSDFKSGKGAGCSSNCTMQCVGTCENTCQGDCVDQCWMQCQGQCSDQCTWSCETNCGNRCKESCVGWCTGECLHTCESACTGQEVGTTCTGCSNHGGCVSLCQQNCENNCVSIGCRSVCGTGPEGACSANCRQSCMNSSCTAMCSDQCADECTACVNQCDMKCGGNCTAECGMNCTDECATYCTQECKNSCSMDCLSSCKDECSSCSDLCYSCIGKCIGVCMVRCENGCSHCSNNCMYWCDQACNQKCMANCDAYCIQTCSDSCISFAQSKSVIPLTPDAEIRRKEGWPNPNDVVRVKIDGFNLVEEVYDENTPVPELKIDDEGNLILISEGTEADEDMANNKYTIRLSDLYVEDEILNRDSEMRQYLLIPQWKEEYERNK